MLAIHERDTATLEQELESIGLSRAHMVAGPIGTVNYVYFGTHGVPLRATGSRGLVLWHRQRDEETGRETLLYERSNRRWLVVLVAVDDVATIVVASSCYPSRAEARFLGKVIPARSRRRRQRAA